jgi:uncharacterized protein (TIGR02588 family)
MTERTREQERTGGETRAEAHSSPWEWVVSGVSALLVLLTIGYVFYKAAAEPSTPPQVVIELEEIYPGAGGYVVILWAHNVGGQTAKDLAIEGQLVSDTGVVATRSAGITFLPGESRRKAGLFFPVDPERYELELHPVGYDVP